MRWPLRQSEAQGYILMSGPAVNKFADALSVRPHFWWNDAHLVRKNLLISYGLIQSNKVCGTRPEDRER